MVHRLLLLLTHRAPTWTAEVRLLLSISSGKIFRFPHGFGSTIQLEASNI